MLDELDAAKSELTAAEEDLEQREVDLPRLTIRPRWMGILLEPPRVNAAAILPVNCRAGQVLL